MTYELVEEILPLCKICVEETLIWMKKTQAYDKKKIDECNHLSLINSNLIYKEVCIFSSHLTIGDISKIWSINI